MNNRTSYILRDAARINERAEARVEREVRAGRAAVDVTGIPAAPCPALCAALDHLEVAFIAWGKAGANHDLTSPLREPWLRAREVLVAAGRLS